MRPSAAKAVTNRPRTAQRIRALVVVDSTALTQRVLSYLGRLASNGESPEFHLVYIGSRVPARLLETGGAERGDREDELQSSLRRQQRAWMARADKQAWRILRAAESTLQRAGVEPQRIRASVASPLDAREAVDEVLLLARDQGCDTVIVGHTAHSWLGVFEGGDLPGQLLRRAKGYAVWVIG